MGYGILRGCIRKQLPGTSVARLQRKSRQISVLVFPVEGSAEVGARELDGGGVIGNHGPARRVRTWLQGDSG